MIHLWTVLANNVLFRYIIAGGFAAGLNFVIRFPLSTVIDFATAVIIAQLIGFAAGFLAYKYWVFPDATTKFLSQLLTFGGVNAVAGMVVVSTAILLRLALIAAGVPLFPAEPIAHATAICCGVPVNFLGHRLLTFRSVRS